MITDFTVPCNNYADIAENIILLQNVQRRSHYAFIEIIRILY
jgi:hypothetical protein